jgi:SAM-dependent methyltransferase
MIHFDKECPDVLFCDNREVEGEAIWKGNGKNGTSVRHLDVHPDRIVDFTAMPFPDGSFWLVVFDPPHLKHVGENAWMAKKYGALKGDWKAMLRDGFQECMRVLKPGGTLIFKWSEAQIPVGKVWEAIGARPVFGTRCGKRAGTIWATFWKGLADMQHKDGDISTCRLCGKSIEWRKDQTGRPKPFDDRWPFKSHFLTCKPYREQCRKRDEAKRAEADRRQGKFDFGDGTTPSPQNPGDMT